MTKTANEFFDSIDYPSIIDTIKGIFTSDASISTLLDFERVLDQADLYGFKNWDLGELVAGPQIKRYTVACTFMYPEKLMPNPKGGIRLTRVGCNIKFKKTTIKVPVKIDSPDDYKPGTHYPKMVERTVWLVRIEMPKDLMQEIREGSIDLAGQEVDLNELDDAYDEGLDKSSTDTEGTESEGAAAPAPNMGMPAPGAAPMPGAMPGGMSA
jgi:hypothetical protein